MAFDKEQFHALMKERFSAAAGVPMPVPDPDLPEEQRGPALDASLKIAKGHREDAIAAIAAQAAGMAVSQHLVDVWPAGATDAAFDVAPLLSQAVALITGGDVESLYRAAALLSIAGFTVLVKE